MSKNIRTEAVDHLFEAILCLKDKEECYTFLKMYARSTSFFSLSQRFEVAKMLMDKRTYLDISEKTGASTATISRVNRSLNYGNDGYDMVFKRLEEKKEQDKPLDQKAD
ncbi:MAG: YerC/YecD family TrpR-related protein [Blautia sp.]